MMTITTTARARLRALPDTGTTLVCRARARVAAETSHFDFFKPISSKFRQKRSNCFECSPSLSPKLKF
jgi:hypothetical protein